MIAIFKREFKSYFTTPIGYIVLAAYFFFLGMFFHSSYSYGSPDIASCITGTSIIAAFILPVLTMRLMSEDRRQKVDQILLTSPVKVGNIVLGKYLAAFAVYAIAFTPTIIFEIIFASLIEVNVLTYLYALLGAFLFGGVLIAIGMLFSALTESPAIAAMLSLLANVAIMVMEIFASYITVPTGAEGFFSKLWAGFLGFIVALLEKMSLVNVFNEFASNIFSVSDVVYLFSLIFVFVFLSVRTLEKRRWS